MKNLFAHLLVSCSFLSLSATGAPKLANDLDEPECAESYRGQGAERAAAPRRRNWFRRAGAKESDDNSTLAASLPESSPLPKSLRDLLQGKDLDEGHAVFMQRVLHFVSSKDRENLALVSRKSREFIIQNDPRKLQKKEWVGGPPVNTPDLHLFNTAILYALKHVLIFNEEKENGSLTKQQIVKFAETISGIRTFLGQKFPKLKASKRVSKFLAYSSLLLRKGRMPLRIRGMKWDVLNKLSALAKDPANTSERDLMRIFWSITRQDYDPTQGDYPDLEQNPDRMSLVNRHHVTLQKRAAMVIDIEDLDFIARYGVVISAEDLRTAARAHFDAQDYDRATELWERLFTGYADIVSADDLRKAARAHFRAHNYTRATELGDRLLTRFKSDNRVPANDFASTAAAHSRIQNYDRAAELWTRLLIVYADKVTVGGFRRAARAHFDAQNYDRAAELRDRVLCGDEVTGDDLREAARAHFYAQNYDQAAKLRDRVLYDDKVTGDDLREAARAHFAALRYNRAAELRDRVLYDDEVTVDDLREAARAHSAALRYDRAAELRDRVLTDYENEVTVDDLRCSAPQR